MTQTTDTSHISYDYIKFMELILIVPVYTYLPKFILPNVFYPAPAKVSLVWYLLWQLASEDQRHFNMFIIYNPSVLNT